MYDMLKMNSYIIMDVNDNITSLSSNASFGLMLEDSLQYKIVKAIMFSLLAFGIILGNALTIAAFLRSPELRRHVTNLYISSLSGADIMLGVVLVINYGFLAFTMNENVWRWSLLYVKAPMYISSGVALGSLLLIATDRMIAVRFPAKYRALLTRRVARAQVVILWIYMILILGTVITYFGREKDLTTLRNGKLVDLLPPVIYKSIILTHIYIVVALNLIAYGKIFVMLKLRANKLSSTSENRGNDRTNKVIRMMILILAFLIICWLPYAILSNFIMITDPTTPYWHRHIYEFSIGMVYFNSLLNPIIYAVKSSEYRRAYLNLLGDRFKRLIGDSTWKMKGIRKISVIPSESTEI